MRYLSSKVRMMSSGSDAPPDTATRSADRSRPAPGSTPAFMHAWM